MLLFSIFLEGVYGIQNSKSQREIHPQIGPLTGSGARNLTLLTRQLNRRVNNRKNSFEIIHL